MSYKINKIQDVNSDVSNEISLSLSDVSGLSNPSNNQILSHDGNNWVNKEVNWVNEYERSANTSTTSTSLNNSIVVYTPNTYIPSPYEGFLQWSADLINSANYADVYTTSDITALTSGGSNSQWFYGFQFNTAGLYRIFVKWVCGNNSPDSAFVDLQISNHDNSVSYGPRTRFGNQNNKKNTMIGIIEASQNDVIGFYVHNVIGNAYFVYTNPNIFVSIEKLN